MLARAVTPAKPKTTQGLSDHKNFDPFPGDFYEFLGDFHIFSQFSSGPDNSKGPLELNLKGSQL